MDYFDINVINNGNNNVQGVWSLNPQSWEGSTGQWIHGRVQIEASGDPEYQVNITNPYRNPVSLNLTNLVNHILTLLFSLIYFPDSIYNVT